MLPSLTAAAAPPLMISSRPSAIMENRRHTKSVGPGLCFRYLPQTSSHARQLVSPSVSCHAALNARCGAEQTQTVTRQSSTITFAPIQGKEKSPELDNGGTGFPPRDDDGDDGGGGGGHGWSGGFFFFGLLALLGLLKVRESEGPYREGRR